MKWPRGKYNGQRIVGTTFKIAIDITDWQWKPLIIWWQCGGIHWLCVRTWTSWTYDTWEKRQ